MADHAGRAVTCFGEKETFEEAIAALEVAPLESDGSPLGDGFVRVSVRASAL